MIRTTVSTIFLICTSIFLPFFYFFRHNLIIGVSQHCYIKKVTVLKTTATPLLGFWFLDGCLRHFHRGRF
ncbi:hypothetical protein [Microviridae sp.]|nr:hypothetical protein [Microviridae sp.]